MLEIRDNEGVRELRLARPPVNALDPALVGRLVEAIEGAPRAKLRAIVLSGQPNLFSAGLDIPALLKLDRRGMRAYFELLWRAQAAIARSPVPIVAAITGHAPAGGTALAIYCDYRIMADGAFRIGLNEVEVGLSPGPMIQRAYERLLGEHRAAELLARGALVDPQTALRIGLVDEVHAPDEVRPRATAYARELLALPPLAFARTREAARASLARLFDGDAGSWADEALVVWFGEETRARLAQLFVKGGAQARSDSST